ncbi:MAG: Spy/CpxP family protein refolding chaperone [Planctomycetes bacterium]|nr:Spy/CpxP family protein refolding chaperone [Planctomycetota bacterium]
MTKIVVVGGFLVAFAAGLVVGTAPRPQVASVAPKPISRGGWLAAELDLTPAQREQLDQIWSDTAARGGRDRDDRRRHLFRERDEAIAALIRPEDKPRYEEILKSHADQMAAMDREWRSAFETSVERTKQILTADQRMKYEEVLRRHQSERGPRDWRRSGGREHDGGKRHERSSATRPGGER